MNAPDILLSELMKINEIIVWFVHVKFSPKPHLRDSRFQNVPGGLAPWPSATRMLSITLELATNHDLPFIYTIDWKVNEWIYWLPERLIRKKTRLFLSLYYWTRCILPDFLICSPAWLSTYDTPNLSNIFSNAIKVVIQWQCLIVMEKGLWAATFIKIYA